MEDKLNDLRAQKEELQLMLKKTMDSYINQPGTQEVGTKLAFEIDALFQEYGIRVSFTVGIIKEKNQLVVNPSDLRTFLLFEAIING